MGLNASRRCCGGIGSVQAGPAASLDIADASPTTPSSARGSSTAQDASYADVPWAVAALTTSNGRRPKHTYFACSALHSGDLKAIKAKLTDIVVLLCGGRSDMLNPVLARFAMERRRAGNNKSSRKGQLSTAFRVLAEGGLDAGMLEQLKASVEAFIADRDNGTVKGEKVKSAKRTGCERQARSDRNVRCRHLAQAKHKTMATVPDTASMSSIETQPGAASCWTESQGTVPASAFGLASPLGSPSSRLPALLNLTDFDIANLSVPSLGDGTVSRPFAANHWDEDAIVNSEMYRDLGPAVLSVPLMTAGDGNGAALPPVLGLSDLPLYAALRTMPAGPAPPGLSQAVCSLPITSDLDVTPADNPLAALDSAVDLWGMVVNGHAAGMELPLDPWLEMEVQAAVSRLELRGQSLLPELTANEVDETIAALELSSLASSGGQEQLQGPRDHGEHARGKPP